MAADVGWLTFPIQAVVGGLANGMTVVCFEGAMDTLLDGADPGQVKQEVSAEVASSLGGYARLGAVEHGEPQGDTSAMEDVSGLQAVQQAVAAAPGT